ncbi:uncharacterized protein LOC128155640 [Crassostrea angulata]|uniref:Uncharacterized protein n=1 Tax=Magallana gigas TaxID=29159 RepID=A0A8W8L0A8_MAGGI|nr:uncharacterized protein LOC128155640 [Crassostrea angulata]
MYKKTDQLMPGHCGSRTVGGNEPSPSTLPTSDTMIKEIVLALAVFSCTTSAQRNLGLLLALSSGDVQGNPMALMALSGAGGAGGSGVGSMMMRLLNNPYTLCKETEGVKAIPCRTGNICNLLSIRQYRMPNLMKCSPAGIGCCLKDYMSLQLSKMMN